MYTTWWCSRKCYIAFVQICHHFKDLKSKLTVGRLLFFLYTKKRDGRFAIACSSPNFAAFFNHLVSFGGDYDCFTVIRGVVWGRGTGNYQDIQRI